MASSSPPQTTYSDSKPLNPHAEPFIQQTIFSTTYSIPQQLFFCRTAFTFFPWTTPELTPVMGFPWMPSQPNFRCNNSPLTSYYDLRMQYSVSYERRIFKADKVGEKVDSFEEMKWGGFSGLSSRKPGRKQKKTYTGEMKKSMVDINGGHSRDDVSLPLPPFISDGSGSTTIMIKNIPNQFKRRDLLHILDQHCRSENNTQSLSVPSPSEYDFVYLPMDFRRFWLHRKISNLGYAFVNFTTTTAASRFSEAYHNLPWEVSVNKKVCEISVAKLQGMVALKEAFKNKIFWCHSDQFLPVILSPASDGCRSYEPVNVGKRVAAVPPKPIKRSSVGNKGPTSAIESTLKSCDSR